MKLQFLGATQTVTGSKYLVSHHGTNVVIDSGLFQGYKNLRLKNREPFPVQTNAIDAILLTHAHLDHSGYLPVLVKNGYKGAIYSTEATMDLCKILLPDSGYLQEEEAKYANKRGYSKHHPALPLYTSEDGRACLSNFKTIDWKTPYRIGKDPESSIQFEYHRAGHLLGAASVLVKSASTSVLFSGDVGRKNDPLIRDPNFEGQADFVVIESTYGDRTHPKDKPEDQLLDAVNKTIGRGGILLIPSFAVGRAQLILHYLLNLRRAGKISKSIPIYLNSPMASLANDAFAKHIDELKIKNEDIEEIASFLRIVETADDSKFLNTQTEPCIIIAASGMATGGRVLHHLKTLAPDPKNTILFVGFQAGGTRGDLMVKGADKIKIHGEYWPIRADVINLETMSAHADANELLEWIKKLSSKPKSIFVTHGELESATALKSKIERELDVETIIPDFEQTFDLTFG